MKMSIDNALGMMPQALSLRAERTSILANNIANADTPGFKARDFNFHEVLSNRMQADAEGRLSQTNPQHMGHRSHSGSMDLQYRMPLMASLDDSSVDTQLEQAEFAANSTEFLTAFRLLNGRITGLMSAIKGE